MIRLLSDECHWPDYTGHCLTNLVASLAHALGAPALHPPLSGTALADLQADERDMVLLVVDGMGDSQLARHGPHSFLRAHQQGTLTSVFPSTTASAITTLQTGAAPAQHGLSGWEMWDADSQSIVLPLPLTTRYSENTRQSPQTLAKHLFQARSWFDQIQRPAYALLPQRLIHSPYSIHHTGRAKRIGHTHWGQLFEQLHELGTQQAKPGFIYAYTAQLDHEMHDVGPNDWAISRSFNLLDEEIERFCQRKRSRPMTLIITADHGFTSTPKNQRLQWEQLSAKLRGKLCRPLSGEGRVRFCHTHDAEAGAFIELAREELADKAWVLRGKELIEAGVFGPAPYHPALASRIGDAVLVMKPGYTLRDTLQGEKTVCLQGAHGGVSREEMTVPLIRIDL
ncbi:alkaline phosphatase family protein [Craterilacuibacter sp. RT1T]|uniref:alkaline phosphatase family protein n=1 Tax=Craterilacuibacter sp. RT1T TaxID=2942211 RepID=UPI0020BE8175|nr:alkaline phosphatase family protein [Craterilacuibacter sp. RT1T]MCL6263072.1 alkaline phosphatase family protein [Craterilacuibacter sp. RT1T]